MNEFEGKTWVGLQAEKMYAKVPHGGTPMAEQDRDDKGRFSGPGGGGGDSFVSKSAHEASHAAKEASSKADGSNSAKKHEDAMKAHFHAARAHSIATKGDDEHKQLQEYHIKEHDRHYEAAKTLRLGPPGGKDSSHMTQKSRGGSRQGLLRTHGHDPRGPKKS